jgi:hypothetical protein
VLVVALCVIAGCAAEVDLAKVTYTRTTVPAAAGGGGGASTGTDSPRANDPAFTSDKLREIDACEVLDRNLLSGFGSPDDPDVVDFSRCSNFMKDGAGKDLNISLTIGEGLLEDPSDADKNIGGLPAIESELDDKTACFETAVTETSPNRGIKVQIGGKIENMCDVGRKVLDAVVTRIRTDPPKYREKQGSLVAVDPCALATESELTAALGAGAKLSPTSLHWCSWSKDGGEVWVWLRDGVDPAKSADAAKTTKVDIGGVSAIQELSTTSGAKCEVAWAHLPATGSLAEVVSISFLRYDTKAAPQGEDACAKAQAIAKAVVPKLPKV